MCELFTREGKRTISLAYNILHRYENHTNIVLKEKMFVLAQQAAQRCPQFTAWDFFTIGHKMIFTFSNLVVTYVIVIVQFKIPAENKH